MKKVKCPDCDPSVEAYYQGETAEEAMKQMYPHYMETHKDIMASATKEKMQEWMVKFKADFDAASEV